MPSHFKWMPVSAALLIACVGSPVHAGVYDLDLKQLEQQTDASDLLDAVVILNDFMTLSPGSIDTAPAVQLRMTDTHPFTQDFLLSIVLDPNRAVFTFDAARVNVTGISVSGLSNNVPAVISAFDDGANLIDEVTTDSSWSSASRLQGEGIARVEILGLESYMTGFQAEYSALPAVPLSGTGWLLAAGLGPLLGFRCRGLLWRRFSESMSRTGC
jgi:hypothetical protein